MKKVEPIRDKELIEEIKRLLLMDNYRNYLLFVLGINTGLRIGDMLQKLFNHSAPSITLDYIGVNQDLMDESMRDFEL